MACKPRISSSGRISSTDGGILVRSLARDPSIGVRLSFQANLMALALAPALMAQLLHHAVLARRAVSIRTSGATNNPLESIPPHALSQLPMWKWLRLMIVHHRPRLYLLLRSAPKPSKLAFKVSAAALTQFRFITFNISISFLRFEIFNSIQSSCHTFANPSNRLSRLYQITTLPSLNFTSPACVFNQLNLCFDSIACISSLPLNVPCYCSTFHSICSLLVLFVS